MPGGKVVSASTVTTKRSAAQGLGVALLQREGRRLVSQHEAIELLELAALAFPPHPAALGGIEAAGAMQQVERPVTTLSIAQVEPPDAVDQRLLHRAVARHVLGRRVGVIAQEHEAERRIGIGEPVQFQALDQPRDLGRAADDDRHDHRGGALGRNALLEVELGQDPRGHDQRDEPVHDGNGKDGRRQHRQQEADRPRPRPRVHHREVQARVAAARVMPVITRADA